ncbi:hypothetical protein Y032_0011g1513 [Ancylostoma ceylanicum]|uniref:Uncharacterized protein n=1 Tax=Ancylostoma ceylanicum TaxID=53326 RepID=A0A016VG70_9BILA|nr:hypothetical protein Y032_0011g1513 [Ancylostoma ceylanicum]
MHQKSLYGTSLADCIDWRALPDCEIAATKKCKRELLFFREGQRYRHDLVMVTRKHQKRFATDAVRVANNVKMNMNEQCIAKNNDLVYHKIFLDFELKRAITLILKLIAMMFWY